MYVHMQNFVCKMVHEYAHCENSENVQSNRNVCTENRLVIKTHKFTPTQGCDGNTYANTYTCTQGVQVHKVGGWRGEVGSPIMVNVFPDPVCPL